MEYRLLRGFRLPDPGDAEAPGVWVDSENVADLETIATAGQITAAVNAGYVVAEGAEPVVLAAAVVAEAGPLHVQRSFAHGGTWITDETLASLVAADDAEALQGYRDALYVGGTLEELTSGIYDVHPVRGAGLTWVWQLGDPSGGVAPISEAGILSRFVLAPVLPPATVEARMDLHAFNIATDETDLVQRLDLPEGEDGIDTGNPHVLLEVSDTDTGPISVVGVTLSAEQSELVYYRGRVYFVRTSDDATILINLLPAPL